MTRLPTQTLSVCLPSETALWNLASRMEPSNDKFNHPYEPYDIQIEFMQKLYQCIENGHVGIFESPTGTGKSLSLICAALTWLRDHEDRQLNGDPLKDGLDWLELAERKVRKQQLLELRQEIEEKLKLIRAKNVKRQKPAHIQKKVKVDTDIREDDLLLEDYDSDSNPANGKNDGQALSSSTLALLEQLRPSKIEHESDLEEPRTKIIFCSRTHSQLTQFVHELRKVDITTQETGPETIRHVPLGSRKNLCINSKVSRLSSTTAINERCLELQKPGTSKDQRCEFLPSKAPGEDTQRLYDFRDNAIAEIQDIEDIARLGRGMKLCPYYAARHTIPAVEVLTLPYPLLLQKSAREALGVDLKGNVVIIDEAHNLTSAIADTLSVVVPLNHLQLAQQQLLGYCQKFRNRLKGKNRVYIAQVIRILKACITCVEKAKQEKAQESSFLANELMTGAGADQIQPHKLIKYIQESKLIFKIEGYAALVEEGALDKTTKPAQAQRQPKGVLAEFQGLLIALMNPDAEGRFFISKDENDYTLKYTLLNPQAHFEDVVKEARSVVLAGGTMSPMHEWSEQLFSCLDEDRLKTYSFGHIVSKNNIIVQPIAYSASGTNFDFTWKGKENSEMTNNLTDVIEKLCRVIPDGVVVFFTSYQYLAHVVDKWKKSAKYENANKLKQIFQETKESSVDELLSSYSAAVASGKGALMLAVMGGKLSEGINFSDELGRGIIVVGLPYPNSLSAQWKAKVEYIESAKSDSLAGQGLSDYQRKAGAQAAGREFADNVTMRAVNQSIGRAIRHKNDYAAIYLIDQRYDTPRIQSRLPKWLKDSIVTQKQLWQGGQVERDCRDFFDSKQ